MIHIQLSLRPIPKDRPRLGKFGVYTPSRTLKFEKLIALEAKKTIKAPLTGPIKLRVIFVFARPKSNKKPHHTQRPDLDNLLKGILDGLNKVAYVDDCQVMQIECEKKFGESDSIEIFLSEKSL